MRAKLKSATRVALIKEQMKLWQRKSLQVVALVGLWHLPGVAFRK